jgi:hypothetical protein
MEYPILKESAISLGSLMYHKKFVHVNLILFANRIFSRNEYSFLEKCLKMYNFVIVCILINFFLEFAFSGWLAIMGLA